MLGAVLAGGESRRFGSDKAQALLNGRPLIEHAAAWLAARTDHVVTCGRSVEGLVTVADRPVPGLGPLGGLCGALHWAAHHGFDHVLTVGCDTPLLPDNLLARLREGGDAAYVAALPIVSLWPAAAHAALDAWLARDGRRSVRDFAAHIGAQSIELPEPIANVNTQEDLTALAQPRQ